MEYVMVKISFSGNDDVNFEGFIAQQVTSLLDWKSQIKENLTAKFDADGYMEIYFSDNNQTPFDSAQEVLDTLTFKLIEPSEFKVLEKIFGSSGGVVTYGNSVGFWDYVAPQPVEKKSMRKKS